ncbi:MAG: tripartite tricarboxylate transporter TctB family protein [Alphaproteobacteria bacterium]|nr:tripartite tricarboxylate transporter TctB family protein [Alphaproteobacteria bacterium]
MRAADRGDLIVGGVTAGFACIVMFVMIPLGVEDPGRIDVLALGPAFWPFVIALFLFAMGALIVAQAWRRSRENGSPDVAAGDGAAASAPARSNFALGRWVGAVVLMTAYYLLLEPLGMVVTSMLAMTAFMLLGGERRAPVIALLAVGMPLALFLFFRYVANVVIPLGVFGDLFG